MWPPREAFYFIGNESGDEGDKEDGGDCTLGPKTKHDVVLKLLEKVLCKERAGDAEVARWLHEGALGPEYASEEKWDGSNCKAGDARGFSQMKVQAEHIKPVGGIEEESFEGIREDASGPDAGEEK